MSDIYLDNTARKRIVTFWIPICLMFLHAWATLFAGAMVFPKIPFWDLEMPQINVETAYKGFKTCQWGIWGLILLLISDKAVELIITRVTGSISVSAPAMVEETTTKKIVTTPAVPVGQPEIQNVDMKVSGDVNVSGQ